MRFCLFLLLSVVQLTVKASDLQSAEMDYMLNCQGCHMPDGAGAGDVPTMKGYLAHFLKVQGGREFLVRVPGSADSPLNDVELAETLNWMLKTFSFDQLPEDFVPYSENEIHGFREKGALIDVNTVRKKLVGSIDSIL